MAKDQRGALDGPEVTRLGLELVRIGAGRHEASQLDEIATDLFRHGRDDDRGRHDPRLALGWMSAAGQQGGDRTKDERPTRIMRRRSELAPP